MEGSHSLRVETLHNVTHIFLGIILTHPLSLRVGMKYIPIENNKN